MKTKNKIELKQINNTQIKISKKGNKYIGCITKPLSVQWECKSCLKFKLEKDIVLGTGSFICKECLMNNEYLKII